MKVSETSTNKSLVQNAKNTSVPLNSDHSAEMVNNRLTELFRSGKSGLLNIYFTAGFPRLNDTVTILEALQEAGADMVEIGMPFSDPVADGPVIQESSQQALLNGMSLPMLFSQLKDLRKEISIPVLLMGYMNPILRFGLENFCRTASEIGVDGIILPDLPVQEYQEHYKEVFEKYNLSFIFLLTPRTSEERVRLIDDNATGFIYVVSTESTTGNTKSIRDQEAYFKRIRNHNLKNPTLIGFNVKDHDSFRFACQYAQGAIIGSAFIKALKDGASIKEDVKKFVHSIKQ